MWRRRYDQVLALSILATMLCMALPADGAWMRLEANAEAGPARVAVTEADRCRMSVAVSIPGVERQQTEREGIAYTTVGIPGAGETGEVGRPSLPAITRLVAIPARGGVEVHAHAVDSLILEDVDIPPAEDPRLDGPSAGDDEALTFDETVYGRDALYPASLAELGPPAIMRDLRLVQVVIYPVRYNPARRELHVYQNVEIEIEFTDDGSNEKTLVRRRPSAGFEDLYRSLVLNYDELGRDSDGVERGSYLIITHDQFVEEITPLAEWKERKGWDVVVTKLSEIDPSPSSADIKNYISDAYFTWEIPPEYVLLVGDNYMGSIGQFPTFSHQGDCTDLPYALLEGNDYFPEVLIGRMSVDSENEANIVVAKTLGYERDPYMGSTSWYRRGLVVAATYAYSCKTTKLYVKEKMLEYGFEYVDEVWCPPTWSSGPIKTSINNGVGYVNYRGFADAYGWSSPSFTVSDIASLTNGWKLPVMTSIICDTGDFANSIDPCFGEAWIRYGTTSNPKGGPVFVGPSDLYTHTKWNNAIDAGIYRGIFDEGLMEFAQAVLRGKIELYNNFPSIIYPGGTVEHYFHIYNVLGDPELNLWTAAPEGLTVDHAASIPLGKNYLSVDVVAGSAPGEGALICLYKEDEIFSREYADADGSAAITFDPVTTGDLWVTVTRVNGKPYLGIVRVCQSGRDDRDAGGAQELGHADGFLGDRIPDL
ncbi:hypothetical protein AMJ39_08820 [candidate division TA06 bacterium DG_24]|uniref:Gingipain domain-containing protein n=1 Tax=candidate division TA06 bacterium DG_24 TaxID=1703770 RepID=A0A0S7WPA4_UNCT6|nr:MAG: hypothetical protein AMJ39_08820 [candidate division TA06 bacterium DG_24]